MLDLSQNPLDKARSVTLLRRALLTWQQTRALTANFPPNIHRSIIQHGQGLVGWVLCNHADNLIQNKNHGKIRKKEKIKCCRRAGLCPHWLSQKPKIKASPSKNSLERPNLLSQFSVLTSCFETRDGHPVLDFNQVNFIARQHDLYNI